MAGVGETKWQKDAADQNFDYMFKLLIIGNSSVGKTSFLFRYADDSFTSAFVSTVGIDFKVKTVFRHDKRVKLQIWVSHVAYGIRRYLEEESRGWLTSESGSTNHLQKFSELPQTR
jgi:GTPase SAR1 and related small G proteins